MEVTMEILMLAGRVFSVLMMLYGGYLCLDLALSGARRPEDVAGEDRAALLRHLRLDA